MSHRPSIPTDNVTVESSDLSPGARRVLQAIFEEGEADVYDLAQSAGTGPRTVQEHLRDLDRHQLVVVSERGDRIRCTPAGKDLARSLKDSKRE